MANCYCKVVSIDNVPRVCILAAKDIQPGHELRYDYGGGNLPWRQVRDQEIFFQFVIHNLICKHINILAKNYLRLETAFIIDFNLH